MNVFYMVLNMNDLKNTWRSNEKGTKKLELKIKKGREKTKPDFIAKTMIPIDGNPNAGCTLEPIENLMQNPRKPKSNEEPSDFLNQEPTQEGLNVTKIENLW